METVIEKPGNVRGIALEQMPQRMAVRAPEDDWTGRNDPKERRKLQNRLNSRLYRKRMKEKKSPNRGSPNTQVSESTDSVITFPSSSALSDIQIAIRCKKPQDYDGLDNDRPLPIGSSFCKMSASEVIEAMSAFERWAHRNYVFGSPRTDLLLTLIQFNVYRALFSNMTTLGFGTEWMESADVISPFNNKEINFDISTLPKHLAPTMLQREVLHHPYIDLFPIPAMRDNLLRAGEDYDDTEICMDIVEVCDRSSDKAGLIVWGEPHDQWGWEASPAFVKKWGWLMEGCEELLASTNYWRRQRGDPELRL